MNHLPRSSSSPNQNTIVSKILQVALGLFVTTTDLPPLPSNLQHLSYDCSFNTDCRWASVGSNVDRWRVARGEPDSLLWLAATGTMQIPREPFVLIESRDSPPDALSTDDIRCQKGTAELSFNYWVIGNADIEICLTNGIGEKFNCTGMLNSSIMPGKVSLKIPELQSPFRIMIQPSTNPGVIVLDDIRYDATLCQSDESTKVNPISRGRPDFMSTLPPKKVRPWTVKKTTTSSPKIEETTTTKTTITTTVFVPTSTQPEVLTTPESQTDAPFDLLILGNKTRPLKDKRTGNLIENSAQLLCDFNDEFACQWGPEAGRWAIIEPGAIPSLENSIADPSLLPTFPAGLVLQGTAMLTSDPIPCQTGTSKVLFRYWSNGDILLQVCALGYGENNDIIHCVDQTRSVRHEKNILAVFEIGKEIKDPFTLNIVPQWEHGLKNRFLVIDEIAYVGQCDESKIELSSQTPLILSATTTASNVFKTSTTLKIETATEEKSSESASKTYPTNNYTTSTRQLPASWKKLTTDATPHSLSLSTKYSKQKKVFTTFAPVFPETEYPLVTRNQKPKLARTTTPEPKQEDYCDLLNCSFDDTACNYLNHGLTKKPWTLRNRGYGYPLTGATDIRTTQTNGQFVSAVLDAGDIAILESPKFNATQSLNVLLFQYFRPSQMTTIRLCLGSRYTNPMRTVSSFVQCPSILRSVTAKNAYRWNTVHIQIPPGTTHFYLVAHCSEKTDHRAAIALDNMRVAICDTRGFAPDYVDETTDFQSVLQV